MLLLGSLVALGQRDSTRTLQTVTVRGYSPERFMGGLKLQRADSMLVEAFRFQTLAEFLATQAPLHLKSYGTGQLTTVGFRGTSASHTAVLWNGININQPFTAQSDFSTIPMAGFDQLSIQYGSAASCVGTDAIGGSILLGSSPMFHKKGVEVSAGQRVASFDNFQTQVGIRTSTRLNAHWQMASKTMFYGGHLHNHFPYRERRGFLVEPSETVQKGLIQDLYWRNQKQQQLSLNIWLSDNKLTLAPDSPISREITRTQAYRFLTNYELKNTTLRLGFIRDIIDYGKGPDFETNPSHSNTDRFIARAEHEVSFFNHRWATRFGSETVHFRTLVDGYGKGLITENRADFYALSRFQATTRLLLSLNLRQAFVTRYDPPFTPSMGAEYQLKSTEKQRVVLKGNIARSYRVPTLNERYWRVLGNPNIRPEHSFGKELGLEIKQIVTQYAQANLHLTAFHNRIDDWTYWNPDRGYRVENLQLVMARGIELQGNWQYQKNNWQAGAFAQYALTRSSQERVYDASAIEIVGKQLIYLPLHTGSANVFLQRNNLSPKLKSLQSVRFTLLWQGNTRRYYTFDNSKFLRGHQLVNLLLEANLKFGKNQGKIIAQADNVLDALYLNVKRNAMPGRSYALNLVFNL